MLPSEESLRISSLSAPPVGSTDVPSVSASLEGKNLAAEIPGPPGTGLPAAECADASPLSLTDLPCFYTLQPHAPTRAHQLRLWVDTVQEVVKCGKLLHLHVATTTASTPPFASQTVNRQIDVEFLAVIADALIEAGLAEVDELSDDNPSKKTAKHVWRSEHFALYPTLARLL
eukprot:GHVT01081602.1.p1 GENE.GHVT01081602.1~~GHVT01081602.1.p1  ORF type:complete len:173 (-),score=22.08 GHVT01081602.1:318-836(-)